jgi:hypothetical protein
MIALKKLSFPKSSTLNYNSAIRCLRGLNLELRKEVHNTKNESEYDKSHTESITDPEKYWEKKQNLVEWYEKPKLILDRKNILKNHW